MRIRTIVLWLALNAVLISAYIFFFRMDFPQQIRIETIRESADGIVNTAKQFLAGLTEQPAEREELQRLLDIIERQFGDGAAVFISDKYYSIQELFRNQKLLTSNTIFSGMQRDYTSRKFAVSEKEQPVIRTYPYLSGTQTKSATFYIFVRDIGAHNICIIYPFRFENNAIIRLGLEVLALMTLVTILFCLIYAYGRKRYKDEEEDEASAGMVTADKQPLGESQALAAPEPMQPAPQESEAIGTPFEPAPTLTLNTSFDTGEAFDEYEFSKEAEKTKAPDMPFAEETVYDAGTTLDSKDISLPLRGLLSEIISDFDLTEMSIFTRDNSGLLAKTLTANKNGIERIKNGNKIQQAVETELRTSAAFIAKEGKSVLLPIKKDEYLLGAAEIIKHTPFNGSDIKAVKGELKNIPEDFFFNKNKAEMLPIGPSYSETLSSFALESGRTGKPFSLVLIYCFTGIEDLPSEEKASVIKLVAYSGLKKYTGKEDAICIYKHYIAVLLKNTETVQAHRYIERIMDFLGRLRLKISEERFAVIKPLFSCVSTDSAAPEALLQTALNEITEQVT